MSNFSPWKVLSERRIVDRWWLRLDEQTLELPNGHIIPEFHLLRGADWAACVALTPRRELVMVRQYRHGLGRDSLEVPAGVIDPGEDARAAVERELLEETGYVARDFRPLPVISPEPSRHTQHAHFFVAFDAEPSTAQRLEASEQISVELHPIDTVVGLIQSGQIVHGVQIGAILLALHGGLLGPA